jgi:hypothetical protein
MPHSASSTDIEKQLHQVRPRIEAISPIAGYGTLCFGIFNTLIGISLFTFTSRFGGEISILNVIFNYQFWGVMFFLGGLAMIYGYIRNDWNLMRWALVVALFFKSLWWFALVFRFFLSVDNLVVLLIWSILLSLQILIYIFFLPVPPKDTA